MNYIERSYEAVKRSEEALAMRERGMRLKEIGEALGVTRERARQLANRALRERERDKERDDMTMLSCRARTCLAYAGVRTRKEVRGKTVEELLLVRGVGVKVLAELIRWAAEENGHG